LKSICIEQQEEYFDKARDRIQIYNRWWGDADQIDIKDVRILWNVNDDGKIKNILIADFNKELAIKNLNGTFEEIVEEGNNHYTGYWPTGLHKFFNYSSGNTYSWWDENDVQMFYHDVLRLFFEYGFTTMDEQRRFLTKELKKVRVNYSPKKDDEQKG